MAEKLVFAAPQQVAAPAQEAMVLAVFKRRDPWVLRVEVRDNAGRVRDFLFEGDQAQGMVVALNKTNNTQKTEERRILEWLQANTNPDTGAAYLPAGTFAGAPD